tara:strand:+ start:889 stop:1497 length:609 start_codon:yes stop_codon:yes gene_type:complete
MARLTTNTINQSEPAGDSVLANNGTTQGARHDAERIKSAFPASPLWEDYNPVEAFENLVLAGGSIEDTPLSEKAAGYWGFDSLSRDYVAEGKPNGGAPNVATEVTQDSADGVGNPYAPQVASVPGGVHGNYPLVTPVDPVPEPESKSKPPFRGEGGTADPKGHSTAVREHTHSLFDSGFESPIRQAGVLGSNSGPFPNEDPS